MSSWLLLVLMLLVILAAAEIFTNALEHLGERLKISEGVTGSLFAAVGTAMPESMVPLVAIFAGTDDKHVNEEIGVGAILGAPLMLSTLTLCLMGLSVVRKRGMHGVLNPERRGLRRDLHFFLVAFCFSLLAMFMPHETHFARITLAIALVFVYFIYVMMTLRVSAQLVADGHGTEAHSEMYLCRVGVPHGMAAVIIQCFIGFGLLIGGAKGFVHSVHELAPIIGIAPLVLSLLIIPVATELPEKVNSILWIRRHKDTLAFGNITGAMVFQGTLLPAVGIMLTPWIPTPAVLSGVLVTIAAAGWLTWLSYRGQLKVWHLFLNGGMYASYLAYVLLH